MPTVQSIVPDYFVKKGNANAELVVTDLTLPSFGTEAVLRLRPKFGPGTATSTDFTGGVVAGGTLTIEINTTSLDAGLYDAEFDVGDGTGKISTVPSDNFKLLEVVEALP